eukprot:7599438-Karenia_brevis.AAC.1
MALDISEEAVWQYSKKNDLFRPLRQTGWVPLSNVIEPLDRDLDLAKQGWIKSKIKSGGYYRKEENITM